MDEQTGTPAVGLEPFSIAVTDEVLDDLHARLRQTRFPHDYANDGWEYGFNTAYLKELVDYWINEYDWRVHERAMNSYEQFKTVIDGAPVHVLRAPGRGPDPMPLVLLHGWPWTYWDFAKVLDPLSDPASHGGDAADSFDVVVISLPGYGFSSPLEQPGWNFHRTADLVVTLMTERLGYHDGFAAAGGDWGALVVAQLGHKYADQVLGVYSHIPVPLSVYLAGCEDAVDGVDYEGGMPTAATYGQGEDWWYQANVDFAATEWAYGAVQLTKPQTLAASLNDSPAGLMAWIIEKRRTWADTRGDIESVWTKDDLCTAATIYWVTQTAGTAARYYKEALLNPWRPSHDRQPVVEAPTGLSVFTPDVLRMPKAWSERYHNLKQYRVHHAGGHWAPAEVPDVYLTDVRDFFRLLR